MNCNYDHIMTIPLLGIFYHLDNKRVKKVRNGERNGKENG